MRHQLAYLDGSPLTEAEAWVAGRQQINVLQGNAAKALIVRAKDRSKICPR